MNAPDDDAVVGAGLIGLATARALLEQRPDARVVVLEKEAGAARHQSGHNFGVIHAGLYYMRGSMKARLCREGRDALRRLAEEHRVPHLFRGKLVVAVDGSELDRPETLRQGAGNGLRDVRVLDAEGIREAEPHVRGLRALHVPETGVIDFVAVARALAADVDLGGGEIRLREEVVGVERCNGTIVLRTKSGEVASSRVVFCAGLQSDRLAKLVTRRRRPYRLVPFRGDFYRFSPCARDLVRGLVYPIPDPGFPFLGIHFTRRLNDELADVRIGPCGVRAQVMLDDGTLVDDFLLEEDRGTLSIVKAPSPAATASLAIGKLLAQKAMERA